jgi:hypothetical protein
MGDGTNVLNQYTRGAGGRWLKCRRRPRIAHRDGVEAAMTTYFVECYRPGITKELADEALVTIGQSQQAADAANCVRPLACILVPSDGMAFFLFSGPSLADIQEVAGLIQLPFDRIVESVAIMLYNTASESWTAAEV